MKLKLIKGHVRTTGEGTLPKRVDAANSEVLARLMSGEVLTSFDFVGPWRATRVASAVKMNRPGFRGGPLG